MKKHKTAKQILYFSRGISGKNNKRKQSLICQERKHFEYSLMYELNVKEGEMDAIEYCRKIGTIQRMDF